MLNWIHAPTYRNMFHSKMCRQGSRLELLVQSKDLYSKDNESSDTKQTPEHSANNIRGREHSSKTMGGGVVKEIAHKGSYRRGVFLFLFFFHSLYPIIALRPIYFLRSHLDYWLQSKGKMYWNHIMSNKQSKIRRYHIMGTFCWTCD